MGRVALCLVHSLHLTYELMVFEDNVLELTFRTDLPEKVEERTCTTSQLKLDWMGLGGLFGNRILSLSGMS